MITVFTPILHCTICCTVVLFLGMRCMGCHFIHIAWPRQSLAHCAGDFLVIFWSFLYAALQWQHCIQNITEKYYICWPVPNIVNGVICVSKQFPAWQPVANEENAVAASTIQCRPSLNSSRSNYASLDSGLARGKDAHKYCDSKQWPLPLLQQRSH